MHSRWSEDGARQAVARWGQEHGEDFALRLYSARLLGADPDLVLHGGGNVSLKAARRTLLGDEQAVIHVKASGYDLIDLTPASLPAVDLNHLRRLRCLDVLDDAAMVNEIRTHLVDASAPTPSIETLLHAFLPHRYVDHSHADAVLVLTNQSDGAALIREALGDRVAIVPYVHPGFELARVVAEVVEHAPKVEGVVLMMHGLITFGATAKESYERHIALVEACANWVARRADARAGAAGSPRAQRSSAAVTAGVGGKPRTDELAPILRGLLAHPTGNEDQPHRRLILECRASDEDLALSDRADAAVLCDTGPLVSDHLIRTKPWYLYLDPGNESSLEALFEASRTAVERYRRKYAAYVAECGGDPADLDTAPRVIVVPGVGLLGWGWTKKDAIIAADIARHTLRAKALAARIGAFESLPARHLFAMEYRGLQQRKLAQELPPLAGQVVAISGGAGAIGAAIGEVCLEAGAHVALTDRDEEHLRRVVAELQVRYPHGIIGVPMDVTDESSVRRGYAEIVRAFGGVDVVVPNAGIAHVAPLDELPPADFRRVMEVNATGTLLFVQAGVSILKRQGLGGHIIINASKNVFAPGKDFGAYSASKAAGHQLGKVAAIELAACNIRVNMINADAVFGDESNPSGLWKEIGPQRAKSRDLDPADLPEFYRRRSLLNVRVRGRHVGEAVVFFARNATPTTGATLPVDGGVVEAFPR